MTVRQMLYDGFRNCGILNAGQGASSDEETETLRACNGMLDSWLTERLIAYAIVRSTYTLVAAQATYTLGPDGDFNAVRPVRIERAGLLVDTNETPIAVLDYAKYADIRTKADASTPCALYDDHAFPLTNLTLYPVPTVADSLVLYTWQQLSAFAALTDTVTLPPGYADAITYNLSVRLAPRFRVQLDPMVIALAKSSKAAIMRLNAPSPVMRCDPAALLGGGGGGFDILTGRYR